MKRSKGPRSVCNAKRNFDRMPTDPRRETSVKRESGGAFERIIDVFRVFERRSSSSLRARVTRDRDPK